FAGKLHAELRFHRVDDILREGLHDYLTKFLERIFELGNRISSDFLVPLNA
ncbi:MAG TPA: alpha-E domain-containing protein, partial [Burkholderiaceae bacterium]